MFDTSRRARPNSDIYGIGWMLLAGLFFSAMVALIKLLGARIPSFEIVFFRSLVQLIVLCLIFSRIGFSSLKTKRPLLQGVRALLAVALINCNFYAFTKMELAEVTAIGFSRNLFLVILAILILHERVSLSRILVALTGFGGVLIIVRPGTELFDPAALIALGGAGLGAVMMTLIRKLTVSETNFVMMTYPALAIVVFTAVPVYTYWVTPRLNELIYLLLMALLGVVGQWCLIQAFRRGEATAVAPASYIRLVFASILGFYLFGEIPDMITILGTVIIIGSNLYLVFQEGRVVKPAPGERVPGDVT